MKKTVFIILASLIAVCMSQSKNDTDKISHKEVLAAKEFYESGAVGKAGSVLDVLTRDKDKKIAEQAWYLRSRLFSNVFSPPDYKSCFMPEFESFAKKNKKSTLLKDIEKELAERSEEFAVRVRNNENNVAMLFSDSCTVSFGSDSTFFFSFEREFTGSDKNLHNIRIGFSGKLRNYQPYGDMKDEWGSTGLLIDTDGNIIIELDGQPAFVRDNPMSLKQYPEYVLRTVTEYGFTQEKTFIREDDSVTSSRLAFLLKDDLIVSDLNIKLRFGKMHELVPYYSDTQERIFPDKFNSKAYVELRLNQIIN
jgi:hypothetical protein